MLKKACVYANERWNNDGKVLENMVNTGMQNYVTFYIFFYRTMLIYPSLTWKSHMLHAELVENEEIAG